ncbi:hypothetical protein FC82_GL002504 [Secundilactobacillus collinoides DSM 20515 = JCM 1123]|uniref:Uncharacterized protein n=1 Tax=Secundilactobacillus collinoides DSM 20515 = JCM 1123 TaxID=1423733 RepID=A0A0R2B7K2_SECCO|nr:hypothetical protein FC82_GL002504 [Secundilactobacillus collinoides DSM 20515 = JCM 1123]
MPLSFTFTVFESSKLVVSVEDFDSISGLFCSEELSSFTTVVASSLESAVAVVLTPSASVVAVALLSLSELLNSAPVFSLNDDDNATSFADEVAAAVLAVLSLSDAVVFDVLLLLSACVFNPVPKNNTAPKDKLAMLANTHRLPDL